LTQTLIVNIALLLKSDVAKRLKFVLLESAVRFFKKFNLVFAIQKDLRIHVHYFFYEFAKFIYGINS